MVVRKVSNSKTDLQDLSRSLALVLFKKAHSISYYSLIPTTVCPYVVPIPRYPQTFPKTKISSDPKQIPVHMWVIYNACR